LKLNVDATSGSPCRTQMNLTSPTDGVNLDSYSINGEWEVLDTGAQRKEFSYSVGGHPVDDVTASATMTTAGGRVIPTAPSLGGLAGDRFSSIAFAVNLRRRHLFYVMNVIMPSVMTSVLLLSVFFCTPAQKVQIGVVVLLSFRIFLLNVAENIPKTSDHVPLLGERVYRVMSTLSHIDIMSSMTRVEYDVIIYECHSCYLFMH